MSLRKSVAIGTPSAELKWDVFNVLNGDGIQTLVNAFGARWREPQLIKEPRLVEIGGQITF